jgi:hypothetical protein
MKVIVFVDMYIVKKIILSELTKARSYIFGMRHFEVDHYQDCSNYRNEVKICPAPGVIDFHQIL